MFSLETEGLRDFTDCRDLKAVICVHMTTRAFQHIPAHFLNLTFSHFSIFLTFFDLDIFVHINIFENLKVFCHF